MEPVCNLASKQPCESGTAALAQTEINNLMAKLGGWQQLGPLISKTYQFKNYYQTIAFVNALAWMTHQANHHPDLVVSYNSCRVDYSTHAIGGLSENDFICAAKADALFTL